ncbi:hypothetical protein D3C78_1055460 [compost metagenome]
MHRHPPRHRPGQTHRCRCYPPARSPGQSGGRRPVGRRRAHGRTGFPRPAERRGRASGKPVAEQRHAVRRPRRFRTPWCKCRQRRVLRPDPVAGPRPARRGRCPRYRSVRPGQHPDGLRRSRRSAGPGRSRQRQPGGQPGDQGSANRRQGHPGRGCLARPFAGAGSPLRRRIHRPRLAAATTQARRPGACRRR